MQNNNQDYKSMLPIGSELQMGKYRVERYLSSGGFGNTYVVKNVEFDEIFAMKEFFMKGINEREQTMITHVSVSNPTNSEQFDQQRDKFKKEARRLRGLHNKHLVQVHDLFEENGTAYYVMDYVEGESLSALLKRTGQPLSEHETLRILSEVLEGLDEVHKQKIWHLDLKPGNIMLNGQGEAILIDFGASKQLMDSGTYATTTGAMCYTPGYAPAEQIDQNIERIGPWTDLYALGATLYNLVSRNTPPAISDLQEGDAAFSYPPSVSRNMRKLIQWMMNPSRQRRPQSIGEVRLYLEKMPEAQFLRQPASSTGSSTQSRVVIGDGHCTQSGRTGNVGPARQPHYVWKKKKRMSSTAKTLIIVGVIFAVLIALLIAFVLVVSWMVDSAGGSEYYSY